MKPPIQSQSAASLVEVAPRAWLLLVNNMTPATFAQWTTARAQADEARMQLIAAAIFAKLEPSQLAEADRELTAAANAGKGQIAQIRAAWSAVRGALRARENRALLPRLQQASLF